jgi:hypothetical protein
MRRESITRINETGHDTQKLDSRVRWNDSITLNFQKEPLPSTKFRTIWGFLRFGAPINRGVAQLVAHLLWEQGVARSNRVAPTFGKDEIGKMRRKKS